jgi:two-component system, cell cycle sensor histidine kinase and response regulator CckA
MGNVSGLAQAEPQSARQTVLVLDDEDSVRRLVTAVLESAGYVVLPAAQGAAALDIARSHPDAIDLLITDMTMPEMDGREAADAIRALRPQCRVLFMSGYPLQVALPDGIQATDGFIQKPFVPRMLVQRVREVLDRNTTENRR